MLDRLFPLSDVEGLGATATAKALIVKQPRKVLPAIIALVHSWISSATQPMVAIQHHSTLGLFCQAKRSEIAAFSMGCTGVRIKIDFVEANLGREESRSRLERRPPRHDKKVCALKARLHSLICALHNRTRGPIFRRAGWGPIPDAIRQLAVRYLHQIQTRDEPHRLGPGACLTRGRYSRNERDC